VAVAAVRVDEADAGAAARVRHGGVDGIIGARGHRQPDRDKCNSGDVRET
jgi:hypothetical protein